MREINQIIIHHSASKCLSVDEYLPILKHQHIVVNGWKFIGYHYLIDYFGNVFHSRPDSFVGAHCYGHNLDSIGICFIGNYNKDLLTDPQKSSFKTLYSELEFFFGDLAIQPHCSYRNTLCPGSNILDFFEKEYTPVHKFSEWCYLKNY